jgi:hypothetical protein
MAPILGILASGISGNLWAPGKDFDSIATVNGNGVADELTFSSIPSTYRHLQIRGIANANNVGALMAMRINGTSSNYTRHYLNGDSTSVQAGGSTAQSQINFFDVIRLPAVASTYGVFVCDILDYADTNKFKTIRFLSGQNSNGSGGVELTSGLFQSTSAINSVTIRINTSFFTTATKFALYGVK